MRTRSGRRAALVAPLAIGGALLLGGCGAVPPGAAAVVDGHKISRDDVQELADAQCAGLAQAAKSGQSQTQETPRKQVVEQALSLLMDVQLSLQYGKSVGISPRSEEAAATYSQVDPLIQTLPKKYRSFMEDTFHRWAEGRDVMLQAGERSTGQTENASNSENLLNAGYQARAPWLKKADIHTDPRYGPAKDGFPGGADPSVSKAVSSFAKDGSKSQANPAWVGDLPSSQKCG